MTHFRQFPTITAGALEEIANFAGGAARNAIVREVRAGEFGTRATPNLQFPSKIKRFIPRLGPGPVLPLHRAVNPPLNELHDAPETVLPLFVRRDSRHLIDLYNQMFEVTSSVAGWGLQEYQFRWNLGGIKEFRQMSGNVEPIMP
jgi:hypothetical protein